MINLDRCNELIMGMVEPDTLEEELFIDAYTAAVESVLLIEFLVDQKDEIDTLDADTIHHMMLGYAWGQYDLKEQENSELLTSFNDKTKKFH